MPKHATGIYLIRTVGWPIAQVPNISHTLQAELVEEVEANLRLVGSACSQGSVERRLKAALAEKPPNPVAHPSAWYGSAAASVSAMAAASVAVAAGGSGTGADSQRSKALSSVKIVESVSAVYPAFADFHAASLMDLVKMLSRQHFAQAAMVASTLAAR